jgi:hypothetical protein
MIGKLSLILAALAFASLLCAGSVVAAQQQPAAPATPPAAAAGADESATDDPGADEGAAAGGQTQQQQRRRMVTTTTAQLKVGDKTIGMTSGILKTDSPDYESIAKLNEGDVLLLTRSQTIKLKTDLPMSFGDVTIKTENVAKGYAGVYGIWLKKSADGWTLVFNERADVWGTMYDPAANVAEVPAAYASLAEPTEALKFELPQSGNGGAIKISWGEHEWTAPFTILN